MPVRRLIGGEDLDKSVEARLAVSYFLAEMHAAAARTFPAWSRLLDDALGECKLDYDDRRALFEIHSIDDYYFAGVVALECARMRGYYNAIEASEILGEVGEQVDTVASRRDRVVSDLVFLILGKIQLGSGTEQMKAPYDMVVKSILQQMGVDKLEQTKALLRDKALRHSLGEPLALGIPQWWKAFHAQFTLCWVESQKHEDVPQSSELAPESAPAARTPFRGRRRRRAVAF